MIETYWGCSVFSEQLIFNILSYLTPINDYSCVLTDDILTSKLRVKHKTYVRTKFTSLIIHTFSSLYYMHFLRQPRTRDEINQVFMSLDYHGLFQDPNYYDLEDYLKVFKIFVERAFDYNVEREPLHEEKNTYVSKYSSNSQIRKSRTLYALNLM